MFAKQNRYQTNTKAVTSSPIVAKAVIKRSNGRYEIIVVFQKSTRQEFYWIFQAKSPRTPQRAWKHAGYAARDLICNDKAYQDFGTFVANRALVNGATVLSTRLLQKRLLAHLRTKTEHESIYGDWSDRAGVLMSQDNVRRRMQNGRRGKWAIFS